MSVIVERLEGRRLEVRADDASLVVDAPARERGEAVFRSTDLLLGSLGACAVGTMLGVAEERGIPIGEVRLELKPVVAFTPERVSKIRATMHITGDIGESDIEALEAAAEGCKIHNSLRQGVDTRLEIEMAVPSDAAEG